MCSAATLSFPCIQRRLLVGVFGRRTATQRMRTPQATRASRNGCLAVWSVSCGSPLHCCRRVLFVVRLAVVVCTVQPSTSFPPRRAEGNKTTSCASSRPCSLARQREWTCAECTSSVTPPASHSDAHALPSPSVAPTPKPLACRAALSGSVPVPHLSDPDQTHTTVGSPRRPGPPQSTRVSCPPGQRGPRTAARSDASRQRPRA